MREFFRGWRRKVGCVALMMACAKAGLWIRSRFASDRLEFVTSGRQQQLLSENGAITWAAWNLLDPADGRTCWRSEPHPLLSGGGDAIRISQGLAHLSVNYSRLVLPLTLLSAHLILWVPRRRTGPDHA